jgi:hypothetical protein
MAGIFAVGGSLVTGLFFGRDSEGAVFFARGPDVAPDLPVDTPTGT